MNTIQKRLDKELESLEAQLEKSKSQGPTAQETPTGPNPFLSNTVNEDAVKSNQGNEDSTPTVEQLMQELQKAEHRYSVLQGKFNKEVKESKETTQQVIADLQKQLAEAKVQQTTKELEDEFDYGVSPEVLETLDPELRELLKNSMKANLGKTLKPIQEELERIKTQKLEEQHRNQSQQFQQTLESLAPGAMETVRTPEFNQWLEESGWMPTMRMHWGYLEEVQAVANVLSIYNSVRKASPQPPRSSVMPEHSGTGPEPGIHRTPSAEKPIYRKEQVDEFYRKAIVELRKGTMSKEEYDKKDALITQAAREGRIK